MSSEGAQVSAQSNMEAPANRSIPITTGRGGSSRANVIAEEAIQQGQYRLHDEAAAEVTRLFLDFLHSLYVSTLISSLVVISAFCSSPLLFLST